MSRGLITLSSSHQSSSIPLKDGVKQIDFGRLYNEKLGDVEQAHKSLAKGYEDEVQKEKKQSERLGTNIAAVIYDAEPDIKTLVRKRFILSDVFKVISNIRPQFR